MNFLTRTSARETSALTEAERKVFDGSPFGVMERDTGNRLRYVNAAALKMMGATDYEGLTLYDLFVDPESRRRLDGQMEARDKGLAGNYELWLTRRDNAKRKVPVQVTGIPLFGDKGESIGSLGIFRRMEDRLQAEIRDLTLAYSSRDDLLRQLADKLSLVFPHDLMIVSRVNAAQHEVEAFFWHPAFPEQVPPAWYALNKDQWKYMEGRASGRTDFQRVMSEDPWKSMNGEPMVQQMRKMGLKTSMWRQIRRGEGDGHDAMAATLTLLSTKENAYDEADEELLRDLPLEKPILRALHDEQKHVDRRKLQLFKDLNRCGKVDEACSVLATALVEMFNWHHVSLFRVNHGEESIQLVDWAWKDGDGGHGRGRSGDESQPITMGILGRVVDTCKAVKVDNVTKDQTFYAGTSGHPVLSELAVPIVFAGQEERVRFIIDVDDPRERAFSTDHQGVLTEIAEEVAGAMQRMSQLAFLRECFNNASDPIFATDARLRIRKANPAAATLLGLELAESLSGSFLPDYFEDTAPFDALARKGQHAEKLGELKLKAATAGGSAATVYVTRSDFPDTLGGHVFIARDLREVRRAVQGEFLRQAAYEIAVETQTPLTYATSFVEKCVARPLDGIEAEEGKKALYHLDRVKNAFVRLGMYNRDFRNAARQVKSFNLTGEVGALVGMLPQEEQDKVRFEQSTPSVQVTADRDQVMIVVDALLCALVRAAPEEGEKIRIILATDQDTVFLRLVGKMPPPKPFAGATAMAAAHTDLRRADPLLHKLMKLQGGSLTVADANGATEFVLRFGGKE